MHFCELCKKLIVTQRETLFKEFELQNELCDKHYIEYLEFVIKDNKLKVSESSYEKYKYRLELKQKPKIQSSFKRKM